MGADSLSSQRFRFLFADDRSVYGVLASGELMWFPHWTDVASAPRPTSGARISTGWGDFHQVFAGGDGMIYAVAANGDLLWHQDLDRTGGRQWADGSGNPVGSGWNGFVTVFSGGGGHIYAVSTNGDLRWYRDARRDGVAGWASGSGNRIGRGWSGFRHLISGGGGVIYAVDTAGRLLWYRDDLMNGANAADGSSGWAKRSGSPIGGGWGHFTHLFAGGAGQIFACQTLNSGARLIIYQDTARDGTVAWSEPVGDPTLQQNTELTRDGVLKEFSCGWQIAAVEGYCWPMSIAPGETLQVAASGSTPQVCVAEIYRLSGRGPDLGQPAAGGPVGLFETAFQPDQGSGVDCGWPSLFTVTAPSGAAAWTPGFYSARLSVGCGPAYDVPFVVKRGEATGEIAVVVNVNTWNAYNFWGGDSNYSGAAWPTDLTHKRPNHHLLTCSQDHINGNHMLRGEIWLVDWLQQSGYGIDLLTDIDLHSQADLSGYRAVVLNTHPEYWTDQMAASLAGYLDHGGNLLYLGGNGAYRPASLISTAGDGDFDLLRTEYSSWSEADSPQYEGKPLFGARVDNLGGPVSPGTGIVLDRGQPFVPPDAPLGPVGVTGWNGPPMGGAEAWGASGWETDVWPAPLPDDVSELGRDPVSVTKADDGTVFAIGAVLASYRTRAGGFVLGAGSLTFVGALMVDPILQAVVHNALTDALRLPIAGGTIASLTLSPTVVSAHSKSWATVTLTQPVPVATEVAIAVLQAVGAPQDPPLVSNVATAPAMITIAAGDVVSGFSIQAGGGLAGARYVARISATASNTRYATLTVVGGG